MHRQERYEIGARVRLPHGGKDGKGQYGVVTMPTPTEGVYYVRLDDSRLITAGVDELEPA